MSEIIISSFQWGLANDRNIWQAGSFWNSKNIEYRKNSSYIELNKWSRSTWISILWAYWTPICMASWKNTWNIMWDLLVFTNVKIISTTWVDYTFVSWMSPVNTITANSINYIIWQSTLWSYNSSTWAVTEAIVSFTWSVQSRPVINFYGDLIIGDGTAVCRYNKDGTLISYSATVEWPVIGGLDGNVRAITQIWPNVYVWCNDTVSTNLYIWDGLSSRPSQKIRYADMPVQNVALLANQHYWWSLKGLYSTGDSSIRNVIVWESYQPQVIVKSDYPDTPIATSYNNDANRMALRADTGGQINDIESIGDIVYLPWYKCIYWVGRYFPWQSISFQREFEITGKSVKAFYSSWTSYTGKDMSWILFYLENLWLWGDQEWTSNYINTWMKNSYSTPIFQSSWEIETMEYLAPSFVEWESNKKITVPIELGHSSCSISVYVKMDRATSYTLLKTLTTTTEGIWFKLAEISSVGKWRTIQWKFILNTSNTEYSPKLYTWITNQSENSWKK